MHTINIFRKAVLLTAMTLSLNGLAQQPFPTGGYQGGTYGNLKEKTWSGAVDEKWNVAGNWCPAGVPGALDDVVIPATALNMPEVKVQGLSCNNVTIRLGATLTIVPGIVLTTNGLMKIEGP